MRRSRENRDNPNPATAKANPLLLPGVHMALATVTPKQDRMDLHTGEIAKAPGRGHWSSPEHPVQLRDSSGLHRQSKPEPFDAMML